MKTVGYIRVSTEKQVEGTSLEYQRSRIEKFCLANDLELASIEEDVQSGFNTDRPGFQSAIAQVLESGGTIIFYKVDRFSRNMIECLETFKMLVHHKIRVVFLADGIDTASSMGPFMMNMVLSMFAIMAEWEREQILDRLSKGREYAKANGLKYTRRARYGFSQTLESKNVIENAEETAAIWRARELRETGLTYRDIADQLKVEGYSPRSGKEWSVSVIYSMVNGYTKRVKVIKSDRFDALKGQYLNKRPAVLVHVQDRVVDSK